MYNVLLKFTFENSENIDDDQPGWLVSGFYKNGQLINYYHTPIVRDNTIIFNGAMLQADSLDEKHYTPNAIRQLQQFRDEYHIRFEYEIIGETPGKKITSLNDIPAFILYEGGYSPVRTLDTFTSVPLYLLPKTSVSKEDYHNIIDWENNYEAIYRLWFRGNVDEQYFYDQLTRYNSALSIHGLEICKQITSLTGINCYYHLFNDPNPDVPDFENCPQCNKPWKMKEQLFDTFKYKCDNCFLIS